MRYKPLHRVAVQERGQHMRSASAPAAATAYRPDGACGARSRDNLHASAGCGDTAGGAERDGCWFQARRARRVRVPGAVSLFVAVLWGGGGLTSRDGVESSRIDSGWSLFPAATPALGRREGMLPAVAFLPGQALRPAPLPWSIESFSRHPMLRKSTMCCTSRARRGVIGARMCTGKGSESSQGGIAGAPEADEECAAGTDGANQEDKAPSTNDKSNSSFWGGLVAQMGGASARVVESGRAFRVRVGEVAGPPGSKLTSSWTGLVNSTAVAVSGGGAASVRTLSAARSRVGPVLKYAANVTSLAAAASAGTLLNLTRGGGRNKRYAVKNQEEMEAYLRDGVSVHSLDIRGRSQPWRQSENGTLVSDALSVERPALRGDGRDTQLDHPVLRVISQRLREGSKPGQRTDNYKIALAIEGGGLRGSVTAGMASAIMHLGMADAFDMVLGSSAGSIIGTYLVARAQPVMTYQFFCNHLTTSREKLNGTSWLDLGRLVDLFTPGRPLSRPGGQAVMVLDYPMKTLMQELLPVDWKTFEENDKAGQSMKVVATGLFSEGPVVLGSEEGSFTDLASLCECVKASCMLPGVAGVQPPWLKGSSAFEPEKLRRGQRRWLDQELSATVWVKAREAFVQQLQRRWHAQPGGVAYQGGGPGGGQRGRRDRQGRAARRAGGDQRASERGGARRAL